jgi:YD repeat-containing protein
MGASTANQSRVFFYDDLDRPTGEAHYGFQGKLKWKMTWKYNEKGKIGEIVTDAAEAPKTKMTFDYDDRGRIRLIEKQSAEWGKNAGKTVYVYDDVKRTEEGLYYGADGTLLARTLSLFDEYGNVLERKQTVTDAAQNQLSRLPKDGLIPLRFGAIGISIGTAEKEIFEYEYDAQGNWIRKTDLGAENHTVGPKNETVRLEPVRTQTRVISYHDQDGN